MATIQNQLRDQLKGILVVLILMLSFIPQAEAVQRTIGLEALGYEADVVVSAPYSSIVLEFPTPRLARMQSVVATVSLTPNSQLNGENLLFFYFNDKLVETRTVKEVRQRKTFTLNLPVDNEFRDNVRLQIKSNMFITDDLCRDYYSGGLHFTLHKDTKLMMNYEMLPVRTVADFFGSFQQTLLVVVPDKSSLADFAPGAWVYGLLKKTYPHLDVQLVRATELAKLPSVPRIWVGIGAQLPEYFKRTAPGVALVDTNTLLISAVDLPGLQIYTKELADLPVFSLNPTTGNRITVTPVTAIAEKTTQAIGFGSSSVQEGIQVISSYFPLFPALLQNVPEKLGIHLEGSYSVSHESSRPARMDVLLNNTLVHSAALDQTGMFKKDVVLPDSAMLRDRNNLNIQFHFPDEQGQCLVRGKSQYAQVYPSSYMWGIGQHSGKYFDWSNIGLFYGQSGRVLIDEKLGESSLKLAGELSFFLNRQLPPGVIAFPDFSPLTQQTEMPTSGYVLAVGMTDGIPQAMQDRLPISLGKNFTVVRKSTKTSLFEYQPTTNNVVGRIGDEKGAPLVIFTANLDGGLLTEALKFLNRTKNYELLTGNILIYQQPQRLYSFDVRDRSMRVEKMLAQSGSYNWQQQNWPLIFGVIGLIMLLLLLFGLMRWRGSRQQESEGHVRKDKYTTPFK